MTDLAAAIRAARERSGLNQSQLARTSGVAQSTIWRIEKGCIPGADVLHAIAKALGVSVETLLEPRPKRRRAS